MVLLKKNDNDLYIITADNIIRYDIEKSSDSYKKIENPPPDNPKQTDAVSKDNGSINSLELSPSKKYIVVSTENKHILIYDPDFKLIKRFVANRAPCKACFTPSDDLIVADKTGDVYLYKLQDDENKPELLLGHLSVILDITFSECGKYIITSDRDEKIRVSHFPNCYNIASYCLGHTNFVHKINVVENVLVSGSGDGTIRFWDFLEGKQLGIIDSNADIERKQSLQEFSEQMVKEKVEISALPVLDMQVCASHSSLYVAISVFNYDCINLYSVDVSNFKPNLIRKLQIGCSFSFCLKEDLYVYDNNLTSFKLPDLIRINSSLDKICEKYNTLFTPIDNSGFTVLYKRKYDNVQEYLKRKKLRGK
ncbi:unnamed protein product [Phyllotreta striolata]|uniref:tRNA (guanine-N(7)-)-methyltransferase non-catalytic subunit wuho n=1 Tax=Phyllotreta striolata TaxID=444603 RepID=A0A9N9TDC7_PHYSR|nr:unnamed protein product [Phyllotreta striolata]